MDSRADRKTDLGEAGAIVPDYRRDASRSPEKVGRFIAAVVAMIFVGGYWLAATVLLVRLLNLELTLARFAINGAVAGILALQRKRVKTVAGFILLVTAALFVLSMGSCAFMVIHGTFP